MAALALSDMEDLYEWVCKVRRNPQAAPNWVTIEHTLRALLDDQAALKVAIDAIDALSSNLTAAQVISTAAKAASEARIA